MLDCSLTVQSGSERGFSSSCSAVKRRTSLEETAEYAQWWWGWVFCDRPFCLGLGWALFFLSHTLKTNKTSTKETCGLNYLKKTRLAKPSVLLKELLLCFFFLFGLMRCAFISVSDGRDVKAIALCWDTENTVWVYKCSLYRTDFSLWHCMVHWAGCQADALYSWKAVVVIDLRNK